MPAMARVGAMNDGSLTERVGRALGEELRLFGFNVDYAPVFDVHTNPANPVIGDRSFGTTPEAVAAQERAREVRRRFQGAGTPYTAQTVNFYSR